MIGCRAVREPHRAAGGVLPADPTQAMTSSHRLSVRGDFNATRDGLRALRDRGRVAQPVLRALSGIALVKPAARGGPRTRDRLNVPGLGLELGRKAY